MVGVVGMSGRAVIRHAIDWGDLSPLRLRSREVAEGLYAGIHRSSLRGAGVEFGGYREYVPGDDLRWLDRRSLLRHDRWVIRQFETETDRAVSLVLDASESMTYRGPRAPAAKIAYAAVVAAALARVALANGDPVSLTFVAGTHTAPVRRASGGDQFERVVAALESAEPGGDAYAEPDVLDRAIQAVARSTRRGAIVVVLSDLLDWPDSAVDGVATLGAGGRVLVVVRVLDPAEADFPFEGPVRLRALEGDSIVETDAEAARARYLSALARLTDHWKDGIVRRGGRFLVTTTARPAVAVVRDIVKAIR
jgi:uncharacterized protein (DUF58 family)